MRHIPFSPLYWFLVAFADQISNLFCQWLWQGSSLASAHCNDEVSISWKQQPIQSWIIQSLWKMTSRWFKVTFWSPSWRSLNPLKGNFNHPKKVTLNHQVFDDFFRLCSFFSEARIFVLLYASRRVVSPDTKSEAKQREWLRFLFFWGKTRLALLCGPTASFGHSEHDTLNMVRISTCLW